MDHKTKTLNQPYNYNINVVDPDCLWESGSGLLLYILGIRIPPDNFFADALFLFCFFRLALDSGYSASAFRPTASLQMHFSCFVSFGQSWSLNFGHPHPAGLLLRDRKERDRRSGLFPNRK